MLADQYLAPYANGISYNIEARQTGLTLGNGVVKTNTFDPNRSQLVTQTASKNGVSLMNLNYSYDAGAGQSGATTTPGNTHQLISLSGTINGTTESASYTYDLQHRLIMSAQSSNGASAQRRFAYDRWANRTSEWDAVTGGNQIQSVTLQQSGGAPTNRITSVTNSGVTANYTYDAVGNVTNDGVHSYTYDAANRVVSVDGGATAQYGYDHQNRRVKKVAGGATTHYVWEGGQVIAEHDGAAVGPWTAKVDYVYSRGGLIATRNYTIGQQCTTNSKGVTTCTTVLQSTAVRYYVSDLWSTRLVLDSSGTVIGRQAHLAFGEEFAESGTQEKHHFTSYEAESESGTDYAVNRQYSQSVGRFGSADPYQASSYLVNPQSWNRYAYVENDPIHYIDPLGLFLAAPYPPDSCCSGPGGCGIGTGGDDSTPVEPAVCDPGFLDPTQVYDGPNAKGLFTGADLNYAARVVFAEGTSRNQGGTDDELYAITSVMYNRIQNPNYTFPNGQLFFNFGGVANQPGQFQSVTGSLFHTTKFRSSDESGAYRRLSAGDCLDLYFAIRAVLRLFQEGPGYDFTEFRGGRRGPGTRIGGSRFGYPGTFSG